MEPGRLETITKETLKETARFGAILGTLISGGYVSMKLFESKELIQPASTLVMAGFGAGFAALIYGVVAASYKVMPDESSELQFDLMPFPRKLFDRMANGVQIFGGLGFARTFSDDSAWTRPLVAGGFALGTLMFYEGLKYLLTSSKSD